MNWTDERVEQLKKLWADGLSASQIAAQLGGVSRNAVIGKVHRLKLSGRGRTGSSSPRPKKPFMVILECAPETHLLEVRHLNWPAAGICVSASRAPSRASTFTPLSALELTCAVIG